MGMIWSLGFVRLASCLLSSSPISSDKLPDKTMKEMLVMRNHDPGQQLHAMFTR